MLASCAGPPKVLHYGNDLVVNGTGYTFSKIALRQAGFDATLCPPWNPDRSRHWGALLPYPPSPLSLPGQVWQYIVLILLLLLSSTLSSVSSLSLLLLLLLLLLLYYQ